MRLRMRALKITAVLLGAAGCTAAGMRIIPVMRSVQVGRETAAAELSEASPPEEGSTAAVTAAAPAETQTVTMPRVLASAPESGAVPFESDASAAMHNARPYLNPLTDIAWQIVKKHFGRQSGKLFFDLDGGGQVRNTTFWQNSDLAAESRIPPDLPLHIDGKPLVLLYHTHTTESYQLTDAGIYDAQYNFRTTEPDKNMVAVGDAIAAQLTAAGIGVVHAGEIHDYPVWNKSYTRSAETVRAVTEQYPGVCISLDIHRDAIASGTTVTAPVCEIGGRQSAQIMIISGCDDGTMNLPNYRANFHFASILQQTAETMYSGFTRPIMFDYRKYNQDLTGERGASLLIEVGSQGNTLDEATYAGELLGKALAETIRQLAAQQEGD